MAKILLLVPGEVPQGPDPRVAAGVRARTDIVALADALRARPDRSVEFLDFESVDRDRRRLVVLARRHLGMAAALALLAFLRRREFDAVLSAGETAGLPFAMLLKLCRRRPAHVTITYDVTSPKKRHFYRWLRVHRQMDSIVVYCRAQYRYAREALGIPAERLRLTGCGVDAQFYRPAEPQDPARIVLSAAGCANRDYATFVTALAGVPEASAMIVASGHPARLGLRCIPKVPVPGNVTFVDFEFGGLRDLYGPSTAVCIPLRDSPSTTGITTLLEAMAMGKPVLTTRTEGLDEFVAEGETGLTVSPGDVAGWQAAIKRLEDPALRDRLGTNARRWVERHATLEHWVDAMVSALEASLRGRLMPRQRVQRAAGAPSAR